MLAQNDLTHPILAYGRHLTVKYTQSGNRPRVYSASVAYVGNDVYVYFLFLSPSGNLQPLPAPAKKKKQKRKKRKEGIKKDHLPTRPRNTKQIGRFANRKGNAEINIRGGISFPNVETFVAARICASDTALRRSATACSVVANVTAFLLDFCRFS